MTFGRLLLRNLLYHWRGNLAVLLGVAVGTAVLTGALLVGDSLRGSLRDRTLQRLEWVDQALIAGRFFRADLAKEMERDDAGRHFVPALMLPATASPEAEGGKRVPGVTLFGIGSSFWPWYVLGPGPDRVWLNDELARELGVKVGDRIVLRVPRPSGVPRESLLGKRGVEDTIEEWPLTVGRIESEGEPGGRFSLRPGLDVPRNAFVSLSAVPAGLGLSGRANVLMASGRGDALDTALKQHLRLDDWGLVLQDPKSRAEQVMARVQRSGWMDKNKKFTLGSWAAEQIDTNHDNQATLEELTAFYSMQRRYLSLESRNLMLDPIVTGAALEAAKETDLRPAPTLIYLADRIQPGTTASPPTERVKDAWDYAIVAALDPAQQPPLGPFLPDDDIIMSVLTSLLSSGRAPPLGPFLSTGAIRLGADEIILAEWDESPFKPQKGEPITLSYYEPKEQGRLVYKSRTFKLAGTVPIKGVAADADLTPEFPGITDKMSITDWQPPFEKRTTDPREERFWDKYRTVPRAYVTLKTGQEMWSSRFGNLTSIRLAPNLPSEGGDLTGPRKAFETKLLAKLDPGQGGFAFEPVRERGLEASTGFMDFGGLFLGFSVFLIAAALLLVGLLFRLNLDRRASEVGLLLATGYRPWAIRWLLLGEGAILAGIGGLIGLFGAVGYAAGLLEYLRRSWPGKEGSGLERSLLTFHATPFTFAIGYVSAVAVSLLTILWAVLVLNKAQPRALLVGATESELPGGQRPYRGWGDLVAALALLGAFGCGLAGLFARDAELKASSFFGSGALLLTAGLAAVWSWLRRGGQGTLAGHGWPALLMLGVRNAGRHPVRSLLTAGLLASATFLVVAVKSFHREAGADFDKKEGGSGGYPLLVETDLPLYQDPNSKQGRADIKTGLQATFQRQPSKDGQPVDARVDAAMEQLKGVRLVPFRLKAGDDASCLNLYQPRRPRLLGVPHELVERGGFQFAEPKGDNLWPLLEQPLPDKTLPDGRTVPVIPVFGEANSVQYNLKSHLDGDIEVPNEQGETVALRFVGLLQDSVFQGEVLMSEANFQRLYPHQEGYRFFLVDVPQDRAKDVAVTLGQALDSQGVVVRESRERVAGFLEVENTYLDTFQALGGLALLLGALGLAVVLLRSVWERRRELALLRALGYRRSALGGLVLAETAFLLVLGLAVGSLTALIAVAPHLIGGSGSVPVLALAGLLGLVLLVGLASAAAAVVTTLRAPLLPALRRE